MNASNLIARSPSRVLVAPTLPNPRYMERGVYSSPSWIIWKFKGLCCLNFLSLNLNSQVFYSIAICEMFASRDALRCLISPSERTNSRKSIDMILKILITQKIVSIFTRGPHNFIGETNFKESISRGQPTTNVCHGVEEITIEESAEFAGVRK